MKIKNLFVVLVLTAFSFASIGCDGASSSNNAKSENTNNAVANNEKPKNTEAVGGNLLSFKLI